ncbi:hypothetical protein [Aquimarina aquimarini]|uniref:hypothetical protein n=1 Tax=Aquimarina aquimarini TaxID=1191734 RepID=UPI001F395DE6|nr:hypothetical protein [Aquimarina aquimarini]
MNKLLKFWLSTNATFSLSSGLVMILFNDYLQKIFGFKSSSVFPEIGSILIIFAIFIIGLIYYCSHKLYKSLVYVIIILDALWVLGSVFFVSLRLFNLSEIGYWLIVLIALIVGFFGVQQLRYINT